MPSLQIIHVTQKNYIYWKQNLFSPLAFFSYVKPDINGKPEEHSSVREMEDQFQTADGVDLNDCFSLYTREEQVMKDNVTMSLYYDW